MRGGIAATKVHVHAERVDAWCAPRPTSPALVTEARLPDRVAAPGAGHVRRAGRGRGAPAPPAAREVHFHEVGGIDAIVDVVGTCAALEVLGVDEVDASPWPTASAWSAPPTACCPTRRRRWSSCCAARPTYQLDVPVELTTPTGAALLAALVTEWGPMPPHDHRRRPASGPAPADLGRAAQPHPGRDRRPARAELDRRASRVVLLEVNVDDATGEMLAHTVAALLDAGAHDAWVTPIVMKKGRPAHTVSALADPALAGQVAGVLTAETGSLGVRGQTPRALAPGPRIEPVEVDGLPVRVKVSAGTGEGRARRRRPRRPARSAARCARWWPGPSRQWRRPSREPRSDRPSCGRREPLAIPTPITGPTASPTRCPARPRSDTPRRRLTAPSTVTAAGRSTGSAPPRSVDGRRSWSPRSRSARRSEAAGRRTDQRGDELGHGLGAGRLAGAGRRCRCSPACALIDAQSATTTSGSVLHRGHADGGVGVERRRVPGRAGHPDDPLHPGEGGHGPVDLMAEVV